MHGMGTQRDCRRSTSPRTCPDGEALPGGKEAGGWAAPALVTGDPVQEPGAEGLREAAGKRAAPKDH